MTLLAGAGVPLYISQARGSLSIGHGLFVSSSTVTDQGRPLVGFGAVEIQCTNEVSAHAVSISEGWRWTRPIVVLNLEIV